MIHPVILCGGLGTRLWPVSRKAYPKQFVPLVGEESLYQMTLRRLSGPDYAAPIIMTGNDFRFMAVEQAAAIGLSDARVVIEPVVRDTAPAILTAALLLEDTPDAMMLVAPSDHIIGDVAAFQTAIQEGRGAAELGALVTFGVQPDRPETGFGYLEMPGEGMMHRPQHVTSFREKPDHDTAQSMLEAGNFLWNAGIFMFRVRDVMDAFESHASHLIVPCNESIMNGSDDLDFFRIEEQSFAAAQPISFDYAVMEKAENVVAVPLKCGWSDLGSWDALWQAGDPDEDGLATSGTVLALDCADSYLRSEEPGVQLVGLGVKNIVAVAMRDAVLVADKSRTQDIKNIVTALRDAASPQADDYPRFHRPWGWYETLCLGERFQVKRIMVKPGGTLSLQSHHHRSEHWIVVAGTAEVTIDEAKKLVSENESVYIPLGSKHRLSNPGMVPMYLIEVQTGSYLGEDDIIRYEDVYNRS